MSDPNPPNGTNNEESKRMELEAVRTKRLIRVLAISYVILPIILMYLIFKVFPPMQQKPDNAAIVAAAVAKALASPSPSPAPSSSATASSSSSPTPVVCATPAALPPIVLFNSSKTDWLTFSPTLDERLILLVIFAGALGSFLHAGTSFSSYVGNKQFSASWGLWYLLRPLIGSALAVILYFSARGGLGLMLGSNNAADLSSEALNPYGVGAIAGLTGMFSRQASDKLADVFNTFFKSSADEQRKDALNAQPLEIASVDPPEGTVGTPIKISGKGFGPDTKITLDGVPAKKIQLVNETTLKAEAPEHAPGAVDVNVTNADGSTKTKAGGFTYKQPTNGPTNDVTKGAVDSATKGTADDVTKGAVDSATKGTADDVTKGAVDSATKGTADNVTKGAVDSATKVAADNATKVAADNATKGTADNATKETTEAATKVTP